MKAYKGFNKDMTCREFQYEEGKEYETDTAELCESGFHACIDPIDCFGYYNPAESVYHEVEIEDNGQRNDADSKVVGKKIKIGAKLSIADICKLHFKFVKEHTTNSKNGGDRSALNGGYSSALNGGDRSALNGGYSSALNGGDWSALNGGNSSALNGGDWSALNGGDRSALNGGYRSALNGGDWSALNGGYSSALNGGDRSALNGGDWSALNGGDRSALNGGDRSALNGGDWSALNGGDWSVMYGGDWSVMYGGAWSVMYGGEGAKAKGGIGSVLAFQYWKDGELADIVVAKINGKKYKPDTWYTLNENGKVVKAK